MKKVLITGITGQDGSYLTEHFLANGYAGHGLVRRIALEDPTRRFTRLEHLLPHVTLHAASIESYPSIFHVLAKEARSRG
jgi:GDPmannose 4,6-dehydratase